MNTEIANICTLLENTFEKNPWHGPSVVDILSDVTARTAIKRLPDSHSIIELVAHMTSWRLFVISRLTGNSTFEITEALNFPVATNWATTRSALTESQQKLVQVVKAFDPGRLGETVPNASNPYSFYTLLHGIIHHDLYHAGQIALIKKQPS